MFKLQARLHPDAEVPGRGATPGTHHIAPSVGAYYAKGKGGAGCADKWRQGTGALPPCLGFGGWAGAVKAVSGKATWAGEISIQHQQ